MEIAKDLILMEQLLPPEENKVATEQQMQWYISLCNGTIVYRNVESKNIFKWIRQVHKEHSYSCRLLLVRQKDYTLDLLWTGSIPRPFWQAYRRQPTWFEVEGISYKIIASKTISKNTKYTKT